VPHRENRERQAGVRALAQSRAVEIQAIALWKAQDRRIWDESVKPIKGVQLVQVQPGQSRSGQAGSESCHSSGNWRVRSVDSEEAGREDSAPTSFSVAMPTPLAWRKAASWQPLMRGCLGIAGVPSPGHAFTETPCEHRRASYLSELLGSVTPNPKAPGPQGMRACPTGSEQALARGETCRQGRPEAAATGRWAVLRAHSTDEGGEPQGSR